MTPVWRRFTERMESAVRRTVTTRRPPVLPEGGAVLWSLFCDLCGARQHGAHGPQPLRASEIEARARLAGLILGPHHVGVIEAMDRAWLAAATAKAPEGVKSMPHVSASGITPALFDIIA